MGGLTICYAEDNGKTLNYISESRLKEMGGGIEELHKIALKNLNDDVNTISGYKLLDHGDGTKAIIYETGDMYDATRLLLVFYLKLNFFVETLGDPFYIAIPCRDFLIGVPESYSEKLKSYSNKLYEDNHNKLTPNLFMFSKKQNTFC